jgi:hypothetical protein
MTVNAIIKESDYNTIRNRIVSILGTGSGTSGWGQTIVSQPVVEGSKVSVNEWSNLRYDILNAYVHITGSVPTTFNPTVSNTIRYSNTFGPSAALPDSPITQYNQWIDAIINDKWTVASPSQSSIEVASPTSTTWPGTYGAFWTSKIQCTVSFSWPTATAARHFFNSGGQLRLTSSRSGGSPTSQCLSWTSLLNSAGTRQFGGNLPGTGTSPANGQNWYRLTNSYNTFYSVSASSPYGGNSYRISSRCPVANNSTGTATSMEFLLEFVDNYVDPGNYFTDSPNTIDAVDGTFQISASVLYASGILQPASAGNFTVVRPTVSLGIISP